jgi:hypothetical protein
VRSGSIRSDPPTSVRKPMRFESDQCLPVWSFNGPSRQDGVCVGSLCEPLLACHSIRFSRFKLQRISHMTCGFPRCVPPALCSAARSYITHSPSPCQQLLETFFRPTRGRSFKARSEQQKRPPIVSEGVHAAVCRPRLRGFSTAYVFVSERHSLFNTRSGLS